MGGSLIKDSVTYSDMVKLYKVIFFILVDLSNSNGHPGPVTGVLDGLIDTLSSMFDICMA